MKNGSFITMIKGDKKRTFFLFLDGVARELIGYDWSDIIINFNALYKKMIIEGYIEE